MQQLMDGWQVDIDRGPEWLFLRVRPPMHGDMSPSPLAEQLWSILHQQFVYRVVLELHDVMMLHSYLIGQLVMLNKRIHNHGGVMRVCGLSERNLEVLRLCRLDSCFHGYENREQAVMGGRPALPR